MLYEEALKYLYSFLNYEVHTDYSYRRDLNLKRMVFLMNLFGNPHEKIPYVLVGGTKGKGSTAYLLSTILKESGYRVGLYTSPHLKDPRERIRVSGEKISKQDFVAVLGEIQGRLLKNPPPSFLGQITFFELFTTAMFLHFAGSKLDLGILEVGLGGRLDATNIVNPLVSILTPISYDHQDKLGHTLREIAREKIPIVKTGSCLVSSRQVHGVQNFFRDWARQKRVKAFFLGQEFQTQIKKNTDQGSAFDLLIEQDWTRDLFVSLPGRFQVENAACAVCAAKVLNKSSAFRIDEQSIRRALHTASWPGRFEVVGRDPLVVLDGAHNGASFRALRESVEELFPERAVTMILALLRDKDFPRIIREVSRFHLKRLIVTEVKNPRAFPCEKLVAKIRRHISNVEQSPTLKEAIELVLQSRNAQDLFLITGSLFLVGEAQNLFEVTPHLAQVA